MTAQMSHVKITRLGFFRWEVTFDDPCELEDGNYPAKWCVYGRTPAHAQIRAQRLFAKVSKECP